MRITTISSRRPSTITDWLVERVAELLDLPARDIDTALPLAELGIDSVGAVSLVGEVEDEWQLDVDPTMIFDYPTIADIAVFIADEIEAAYERAS
jgi:acyl carrier protein